MQLSERMMVEIYLVGTVAVFLFVLLALFNVLPDHDAHNDGAPITSIPTGDGKSESPILADASNGPATPTAIPPDAHITPDGDAWFVPEGSGLGPLITRVKTFVTDYGVICDRVLKKDGSIAGLRCRNQEAPK